MTAAIVTAVALTAGACGASSTSAGDDGLSASTGESASAPLFGDGMPTVDGGQLDANDIAGEDVVLWFWAPW